MTKIDNFTRRNLKTTIEPAIATGAFNADFIIKAIGYPSRYLKFDEIYYNGERVDEDTELDLDALGLKEIESDQLWKDQNVNTLVVIPKGSKIELQFDAKNYDPDSESFTAVDILFSGIRIHAYNDDELDDIIDYVEGV